MPTSGTKSLEMMIGGLLQATQDMHRDITEIRRDIKDSDARAALSYEQSEQRRRQPRENVSEDRRAGRTRQRHRKRGQQAQRRHDQRQGSDG